MSNGYDSNTISLLHFDNNIKDVCGTKWNKNGTPILSNTQKKYGYTSLYLDGNSYIDTPYNDKFNFNTTFTIDWWIFPTSSTNKGIFAIGNNQDMNGICLLSPDQNNQFRIYVAYANGWNAWPLSTYVYTPTLNAWNHIAFIRNNNYFYFANNGTNTLITSSFNYAKTITSDYRIMLGNWYYPGNNWFFTGYIDKFRISNIARWTSNFTPSSIPYLKQDIGIYKNTNNDLYGYK